MHKHEHEHEHHHHHHHHAPQLTHVKKSFLVGMSLNILFVIVEVIYGLSSHSLALLSDAGHNLSDVASLLIAFLAFRLSEKKPTGNYTYGFQKSTILAAFVNASILLIAIGAISVEAVYRFGNPEPLQGKTIAWVAFIGIVINGYTALLFMRDKEKDINVKGAYLHMATDALVSLGVVVGGILIFYTQLYWLDSLIGFFVAFVIFFSTWKLLKQTVRLSLDGVPHNVDVNKAISVAQDIKGVLKVHHVHIWALSTTSNALTAQVVIDSYEHADFVKKELKHAWEHVNIQHCTIELELSASPKENC